MDIRVIKAVLGLFEKSVLNKMEITEGEFTIRLEKGGVSMPEIRLPNFVAPMPLPASIDPAAASAGVGTDGDKGVVDFNNAKEVKSPMVGVFYAAPSPDSEPFVGRGAKVKKGDILCVIEAMKVLNEITSPFDGEVADICADNGQLVEFSQVLFKIV